MSALAKLSAPVKIGGVELRNRVVMAPMDRNYCEPDGSVSARYVAYLTERAAGGAALVYPEAAFVRADGRCQAHQMGLHSSEIVDPLARLADAVHQHGALLGVQLNHGGNTSKASISGYEPVAPSAVPCAFAGGHVPAALGIDDIHHLVECYADAAVRSVDAGVDVIMIHAAHGYLVHQFMMPSTNRRVDEYGDPSRFLRDVIAATRAAVPRSPIVLRVSADDGIPGGLDVDATLAVLHNAGVDAVDCIDVSAGSYEAPDLIIPAGEREVAWLAPTAGRFRVFGKLVSVAGRIPTLEAAETVLESGSADLVSVARAMHADPMWPLALAQPEAAPRPRPCIACNLCIDELGRGAIRCSVNPRAGRELDVPAKPVASAAHPTTEIVVVGAGPAGSRLRERWPKPGRRSVSSSVDRAWAASLRWRPRCAVIPNTGRSSAGTSQSSTA
jgi:2,4-dienoyl-CoA reductase-like NADH-dependent reductase (Old Yellow Enzyme family)